MNPPMPGILASRDAGRIINVSEFGLKLVAVVAAGMLDSSQNVLGKSCNSHIDFDFFAVMNPGTQLCKNRPERKYPIYPYNRKWHALSIIH